METLTSKDTASVVDDLIKINNDRIEGYEKALKDIKHGADMIAAGQARGDVCAAEFAD